jgi:hypothetical protein
MAALDWQTPRDALNALTLSGADDRNRDNAVSNLTHRGTAYDAARADLGASGVDAAKAAGDAAFASATAAWETSTQLAHETADQFARFIVGGSPIPFAPDASNQGALATRMDEAETALTTTHPTHPKASLREELDVHQQGVASAYGARPKTPSYGPPYTTRTPILGGISGTTKAYNLYEYERDVLGPLIAEADLLLAELAFT